MFPRIFPVAHWIIVGHMALPNHSLQEKQRAIVIGFYQPAHPRQAEEGRSLKQKAGKSRSPGRGLELGCSAPDPGEGSPPRGPCWSLPAQAGLWKA